MAWPGRVEAVYPTGMSTNGYPGDSGLIRRHHQPTLIFDFEFRMLLIQKLSSYLRFMLLENTIYPVVLSGKVRQLSSTVPGTVMYSGRQFQSLQLLLL